MPPKAEEKDVWTGTHLFLFFVELFPLGTEEFAYFAYTMTESP